MAYISLSADAMEKIGSDLAAAERLKQALKKVISFPFLIPRTLSTSPSVRFRQQGCIQAARGWY
jgi:hypothetical protein